MHLIDLSLQGKFTTSNFPVLLQTRTKMLEFGEILENSKIRKIIEIYTQSTDGLLVMSLSVNECMPIVKVRRKIIFA